MSSVSHITTAEQLLRAGDIGRCELVRGELFMMSPAGGRHGRIAMMLGRMLDSFVSANRLGACYAAETGFTIERDPDTVRGPDAAFVRSTRLHLETEEGFFPGAPDLAVEVISANDSATDVLAKVHMWLDSGSESVWVADPKQRTISVYRKDRPVAVFREEDTLTDEPILPGFALDVADLYR